MNDNTAIINAQQSEEIISSNGQPSNNGSLTAIYGELAIVSAHSQAAERGGEPPMKLVAITRSDPPRVDGPCHPYSWRLDGKTIGKMRTGSWKMVAYLWQQLDRAATYVDLLQPVYDDAEHVADANAFGSLCKAANKFFKEHRIPWRAGTKKAVVYLESA
jgi:hypothetical protein